VFTPEEVKGFWPKGQKHGGCENAKAVAAGQHQGYLKVNLTHFHQGNPLLGIRMMFAGLALYARGFTDSVRSCLILLGAVGMFTGLHIDWTEAYNIAFATCGENVGEVLAVWVFIHPSIIHQVSEWLKAKTGKSFSDTSIHLTTELVSQLQAFANGIMPCGGGVVVLNQCAGDMVYVPPGWVHQVTNALPCLKVAWDFYEDAHWALYAQMHHKIIVPLFGSQMAEDYMGFARIFATLMNDL
jgi:hypothetical protein